MRSAENKISTKRPARELLPAMPLLLCLLCLCRNPFFPPIGVPDAVKPLRSTPEGVVTQLINAYQQRRIDLYEDLFPKSGTFQFFVTSGFVSSYQVKNYVNPPEPADPRMRYIGNYPYYYYWKQDIEIQSHREMFRRATAISFSVKPDVNPGKFRYITDETGDTANVELEMTSGEFVITVEIGGSIDPYPVSIDRQVFLLERDDEQLWVIRKWYDFGNQP